MPLMVQVQPERDVGLGWNAGGRRILPGLLLGRNAEPCAARLPLPDLIGRHWERLAHLSHLNLGRYQMRFAERNAMPAFDHRTMRTVLIAAARVLAAQGAQVVGAARDLGKARAATAHVGADAAAEGGLRLVELDLESLVSGWLAPTRYWWPTSGSTR